MSDHIGLDEEQLDRMISSHYRSLDDAAVPIKLHGRIVATVQARMERRGPAGTPLRLWRLAPAGLALLAVVAIAVATLPAFYSSRPTSSATASAQVSALPVSPSPEPSYATDPSPFSGDPRLEACGGLKVGVEAVVALDHAWAYRAVLPGFGFAPQLEGSAAPALLVVLSGGWPGGSSGWRHPGSTPTPSPTPTPTKPPGIRNVCIAIAGDLNPPRVSDVKMTPFYPGLATLAAPPAAQAGRAHILAHARSMISKLAWDARNNLLWYVDTMDGAFYQLNPTTGASKRWPIPEEGQFKFGADLNERDVVVDDTGAVWCDLAGQFLLRLDPATGSVTQYAADLSVKPIVPSDREPPQDQVTTISAIAADGDGVLIARTQLPYLTRVDSTMKEVGRIRIPDARSVSSSLATLGDQILIGDSWGTEGFALLSRQGEVVGTLPYGLRSGLMYNRLSPDGQGHVAIRTQDEVDLIDSSGDVVSRLPATPAALDLPLGGFMDTMSGSSPAEAETVITDWKGTVWYALGGWIIEVRAA